MTSRYDEILKSKQFLPCHIENLTEKTIYIAAYELGETEETKAKAIIELRRLVQNESQLVCPTSDAYMIQYLRPRKYNVKKAFSLLQNFYQVKKGHSDMYDTVEMNKYMAGIRARALSVFPYRDEEDCLVLLIKIANWDPDTLPMSEVFVCLTASVLFCVEDPTSQINGMKILIDAKGISLKQLRCITPKYMTLISKALRNCLPARFKSIHVVNESFVFQYFWRILKFFLSEKIKKRFYFHGDNHKNLHKCIDKAILPSEYGGDYTQHNTSDWYINEMEKYFEKFFELTTYGYRN